MTAKQEEQIQTAIRIPKSLLRRIDRLAEHMSKEGMLITRADVHRIAIFDGVAGLEAKSKKKQ